MEQKERINGWFRWETNHIGVLDGVRTAAIFVVLWFHFWQQTWLMPYYPTPFLAWLGIQAIDLNAIRRCGYLCVDLTILLSGFVLFLPYARNTFEGKPLDSIGAFYRKRAARILPSYLFAVLAMFFVAVSDGAYATRPAFLWKDLLTHLSFTFLIWPDTYLFSAINGVFWTVAIEMMFYSFFPFLAKFFQKHPLPTYLAMLAIGAAFTFGFCLRREDLPFMANRFLTFFPVFANGMLCAYAYVWFVKKAPQKLLLSCIGTVVAALCVVGIVKLFSSCSSAKVLQAWQLTYRIPLSYAFGGFVLGMAVSARPIRMLLSNSVMRAGALISYNLYLWHQFLIVRLRMALGCRSGADVVALGVQTQWMLHTEALLLALVVSIVLTYGLEKPLYRWIMGGFGKNRTGEKEG